MNLHTKIFFQKVLNWQVCLRHYSNKYHKSKALTKKIYDTLKLVQHSMRPTENCLKSIGNKRDV